MKSTLTVLLLIISITYAHTQSQTEAYMKKIPPLPKDSCGITRTSMESFTQNVIALKDQLDEDISVLDDKIDEQLSSNQAAAKEVAIQQMSQYGMSPEEINKMKNAKNMSAADKQAMANQMMQQQTKMSMEEIQNLSKMSDAGKKAYAEAYGTEMMATAQANPKQHTTQSATIYELVSSQQAVMANITSSSQKIGNLYATIENDASGKEMLSKIDIWHNQLTSMMGIDYGQGKKMDSLALLIKTEQIRYCEKFSPKYRSALRQHLQILKSSLTDYQNIGEITADLTKAQTGIVTPPECTEMSGLKAIEEYLNKLVGLFKYNLWFPDDNL